MGNGNFEQSNFFTPEFLPFPKDIVSACDAANLSQDGISDEKSRNSEDEPFFNTESDSEIEPSEQHRAQLFENLEFKDLTWSHCRKKFWQVHKYQKSEFWRRVEHSFRVSLFVAISIAIFWLINVERLFFDKIYVIVFAICCIQSTLAETVCSVMDALFGVALALVFPYLGLMIAPHNKEAVLAMIFVSTLIVIFFVGANNAVRFWFSVHNIYFFFIFLSVGPDSLKYPARQMLDFLVAALICVTANIVPLPSFLTQKINYKTHLAFEEAISTFKLLLIAFSNPASGKSAILLSHIESKLTNLEETRIVLIKESKHLWVECLFDLDFYLQKLVLFKIVNNITLFLRCLFLLVSEQVTFSSSKLTGKMAVSIGEFIKVLEIYAVETVNCCETRRATVKDETRLRMKEGLDELWSTFRNMRYRSLYSENADVRLASPKHLLLDFSMFCVSNVFYSFTLLDQLSSEMQGVQSNWKLAWQLLKEQISKRLNKKSIKKFFLTTNTYFDLIRNSGPILIAVTIAFYTPIFPYTMNLIFPVGFCWTNTLAGTYNKNLQRLIGTVLGSFYALFVLTLLGDEVYVLSITMAIVIFFNTFIGKNKKYDYLAEVSSFIACSVMLTDYSSADDINESVFRVIKITIGGVSLSIVFLMIANAKRAASLILIKIEEEFSMICQILEEQKTVFRGVQSKDFEGKETFEMVKEIVLDNDLVISWEPPSLDKFNSARMCTLNDKLYAFKSNHQIMSELQGEAENEPELYFKNVSPANLKEIIEATANLSNFVIVSAHALNDCEIKNTAQYEIICLDYETIFNSIKESLENIIEAMKTPKKCLEKKFEDDFDKTREFCDKIMENFDMYFEAVKKFLGTRKKWSIIKQDVSFEQYRLLWGLNAYFYALKKVMRNVIVLQQIAVFLVQNQQHMLWRDN